MLRFNEYLLCARHWTKHFNLINLFALYMFSELGLRPFYYWSKLKPREVK